MAAAAISPPWDVIMLAALQAMGAAQASLWAAICNPAGARAAQASSQGSASLQQVEEDRGSPLERVFECATADF